ncbi:AP-3 complex subunit beta-2 [Striga asiatica]|uniref:AP-3 complex subunit beta n=1 Tax=Striga asiatica TaxID=4170 RepID=A0A5A7PQ66_STRAF|nr:AP-3 complex subunit beta-2 [Striga asiatica]
MRWQSRRRERMLTQFGATAESLSKASTMVFRIGTDAHLYDDPDDVSIAPLLDSKFDSEKCEALKRLLALIAQGLDVSSYFPQVVKNVASQSLEVKKLVYLYLLHYAEKRPNEALLSINCFQKDLGDPNPLVRAWALRTMAGIRLHVIAQLVLVAVGKCARDPSVYVRKCAATALPKLHDLRLEEHTAAIEEIVGMLLKDNSPGVVGAAAAAFSSICPNNFSLIGRNYKRLCETLPDVEEWGQIVLIGILLRYAIAKHGLVRESLMMSSNTLRMDNSKEESEPNITMRNSIDGTDIEICPEIIDVVSRSYLEGPDKYLSQMGHVTRESVGLNGSFVASANNDDVKILLQCTLPLLWSSNSAVVLAAAGVHWIMAPKEDLKKIVKPLLFLLRSSSSSKYVVLCNIQVFAKAVPSLFSPCFEDFFISSSDSYRMKSLKLEILSSIATSSSMSSIFLEFQWQLLRMQSSPIIFDYLLEITMKNKMNAEEREEKDYIRDPDRKFAADTVAAIGLCAQRLPDVSKTCMEGLLFLALSEPLNKDAASFGEEEIVLVQVIRCLMAIIKQDPPSHEKVIVHLVRSLDSMCAPAARAMIVWMMGEYCNIGSLMSKMIPTVLKYLAQRFSLEAVDTKLQIINSCVKILLHANVEDISDLRITVRYVLELANCDSKYDVRDRAHVLKNLLSHCAGLHDSEVNDTTEFKDLTYVLAQYIFGGQIKVPSEPFSYRFYLPGSLSQVVLHAAPGYEPLPEPCSSVDDGNGHSPSRTEGRRTFDSDPSNISDSESVSGSLDEENTSDYSPQGSASGSSNGDSSYDRASDSDEIEEDGALIHLSDGAPASSNNNEGLVENNSSSLMDLGELMPKRSFESWLNESPGSRQNPSAVDQVDISLARISIKDIGHLVKPKSYTLVDPSNGNGLSVDYTFSTEVSSSSPQLVCLQVSFRNCSAEPMSNILLSEEEPNQASDSSDKSVVSSESISVSHAAVPALVPMDEIGSLGPGQTMNRKLQVHFEHHLLPLKLVLWCNGRKQAVKLRPDIGYFIKPIPMNIEIFTKKESQLRGMFEYTRSCTFTDHISQLNVKEDSSRTKDNFLIICEKLALKMLSNANFFLVSMELPVSANLNDVSGLCLRFSAEILSNSIPCLVTLTLKGTCNQPLEVSVKMNCEETVFGLNLLNRIVVFLAEPIP